MRSPVGLCKFGCSRAVYAVDHLLPRDNALLWIPVKIELARFKDVDHAHVVWEKLGNYTPDAPLARNLQTERRKCTPKSSSLPRIGHEYGVLGGLMSGVRKQLRRANDRRIFVASNLGDQRQITVRVFSAELLRHLP